MLEGKYLVVEEKIDGANSGISFSTEGELLLQSRGHFLTGGLRERHFNLLKTWSVSNKYWLWEVLGDRYIMYGEWMYAKHTVFYDMLPHYFLEFDIWDKREQYFLSTAWRQELLVGHPVVSVPILYSGTTLTINQLHKLVKPSLYKSRAWKDVLQSASMLVGYDPQAAIKETNPSDYAEGLYIKVENDDETVDRYKWVRHDFLTSILESETHWLDRTIIPNRLAPGIDIFNA